MSENAYRSMADELIDVPQRTHCAACGTEFQHPVRSRDASLACMRCQRKREVAAGVTNRIMPDDDELIEDGTFAC